MHKAGCRVVHELPQMKEALGSTNTEGEVEKGNKEGPKEVGKESNRMSKALIDKRSILRKPKCHYYQEVKILESFPTMPIYLILISKGKWSRKQLGK